MDIQICHGTGEYLFTGPTFRIWDISNPIEPTLLVEYDDISYLQSISQSGSFVYVSGASSGFNLWELKK